VGWKEPGSIPSREERVRAGRLSGAEAGGQFVPHSHESRSVPDTRIAKRHGQTVEPLVAIAHEGMTLTNNLGTSQLLKAAHPMHSSFEMLVVSLNPLLSLAVRPRLGELLASPSQAVHSPLSHRFSSGHRVSRHLHRMATVRPFHTGCIFSLPFSSSWTA
jgi:hypothetical protein